MDNGKSGWSAAALVHDTRMESAELARFLRLTAPAFHRSLERDRFTRQQRSKLVRLVTVRDRAQRVLGDHARAVHWLTSANRALSFSAPLELLETNSGLHRVYGVLLRIENGYFA